MSCVNERKVWSPIVGPCAQANAGFVALAYPSECRQKIKDTNAVGRCLGRWGYRISVGYSTSLRTLLVSVGPLAAGTLGLELTCACVCVLLLLLLGT